MLTGALLTLFPLPYLIFAALRLCEGVGAGLCISTGGMLASCTGSPTRAFSVLQLCQILGTVTIFTVSASLLAKYGFAAIYGVIALVTLASLIALQGGSSWLAAPMRPRWGIVGGPGRNPIVACFGSALLFCMFVAVAANAGVINVDGLFMSLPQFIGGQFYDLQRFEVLRVRKAPSTAATQRQERPISSLTGNV